MIKAPWSRPEIFLTRLITFDRSSLDVADQSVPGTLEQPKSVCWALKQPQSGTGLFEPFGAFLNAEAASEWDWIVRTLHSVFVR